MHILGRTKMESKKDGKKQIAKTDTKTVEKPKWGYADFLKIEENELVALAIDLLKCEHKDLEDAAYHVLMHRCLVAIYEHLNIEATSARSKVPEEEEKEYVHKFIIEKLPKALPRYRKHPGKTFQAWLATVWENFVIDELRKEGKTTKSRTDYNEENLGRNGSILNDLQTENTNRFSREHDSEYVRMQLERAIESLPYIEGKLVNAYYIDETPLNEVANELKISYSNAKVTLFRARRRLKKALKPIIYDSS